MSPPGLRRAVVGAVVALAVAGSLMWWVLHAAPGSRVATPTAASPSPRPASSPAAPSGPSPSHTWAVPLEGGHNDQVAALVAAQFLERAVGLDPEDRVRWARAVAAPGKGAAAAEFVDRWVDGLVGGRAVRPAPQTGSETGVSLRTLGARVLRAGDDPDLTRVILWQQVTVDVEPVTSAYLLAFVTVAPTVDGPLLSTVDGVRPGPDPDPGTTMVYPPLEP